MTTASIDFETRSDVDLKTRGAGPYFASPRWAALIMCYRIDDGPMRTVTSFGRCPDDLAARIRAGGLIRAHNASFERHCFDELAARFGWPRPALEQYRDTAAEAAAMGLPRDLAGAAEALGTPVQKDKAGKALIRWFCVPRRDGAFNEPSEHPEKFAQFCAYCATDVDTERAVAARLVPLSDYETAVYHLSERINDRGIRIDRTSARAALLLAERAKALLDAEMAEATGGAVRRCTEVSKLTAWVQSQGVEMSSAAKAEITELLGAADLPAAVRRVLELRQEAAKTSVSKLKAMLDRADADGRIRGSFLYHAAGTGRWSNVGVNFGNLPRPRKAYEKAIESGMSTRRLFDAIRTAEPRLLPFLYGEELGRPLHLISDAIRGFLWAAPSHEYVQADYSSIEGVVIAWSSGEHWKIDAMRAIAADPSLPDLYRRTAAAILGLTTDVVTKKHWARQAVGKVSELALGFGGGVGAFYTMSKGYGVDLRPLYEPVWGSADEERREKAEWRYKSCLKRKKEHAAELSREEWIACELIKTGWRAANPAIAAGWKLREDAVREAIRNPGAVQTALKFSYVVKLGLLWARLPSGRCLAYGAPKLTDQVWAKTLDEDGSWSEDEETFDREEAERLERAGRAKITRKAPPRISALGVDSATRRWVRYPLYGGLLAENDTQATARDLLVNGMFKAEAAGYPIVAHVYDEMIAEVPAGFGDVTEFERLICELPAWAAGIPLAASGWRGKRFRKD